MTELAAEILDRMPPTGGVIKPMQVETVTPTLTVKLDGDLTALPARSIEGQTFIVGERGFALYQSPLPPLVFTTWPDFIDAGFVDLTYESGFTNANGGQAAYQKIGKQVFLEGGANRTAGNFTTTAETVAILPVGARPARTQRYASYGTGGRLGRVEIETNGNINIAAPNLVSSTDEVFGWLGISHTFLTD